VFRAGEFVKACVEGNDGRKKVGVQSQPSCGVIPGSAGFQAFMSRGGVGVWAQGTGHAGNPKHMLPCDAPLRFPARASARPVPMPGQETRERQVQSCRTTRWTCTLFTEPLYPSNNLNFEDGIAEAFMD